MEKNPEQNLDMKTLKPYLKPYTRSNTKKAVIQILDTVVPYFGLWGLMIWSLQFSYWFTLGLAVIAALFLVRI